MVINYDRNPNLTTDQKLDSLIESIMLAMNEKADNSKVDELKKKLAELQNT